MDQEFAKYQEIEKSVVIYRSKDGTIQLDVQLYNDTVWLTQAQISELFHKDISVISRHIKNIYKEGELEEDSNLHFLQIPFSDKLKLDLQRHNSQYRPITIKHSNKSHDHFLIIDEEVYHIGASLKDLGKKMFAFTKLHFAKEDIVGKI